VVITGGAGQIAYSLLPSIASGSVFGMDQPVIFHLLDIAPASEILTGVKMEIEDLAYPLVLETEVTCDAEVAFRDADYAIFLGAFPRKEGMERKDVMQKNVGIFNEQGLALAKWAKSTVKCLVVGNPANTNAAILSKAAPAIPQANITALTRLDHNRAVAMLAQKGACKATDVDGVIIWGNHSSTQYPDVRHTTLAGAPALAKLDKGWLEGEFIATVQKRGAAIIKARKLSSAASAAKAICDHLRDWTCGTNTKFISMAVFTAGGEYGVPPGICYSLPVVCAGGSYTIVKDLPIDEFSAALMKKTLDELVEELALANELLSAK